MKVCLVQLRSQSKDVPANQARADALLAKVKDRPLDLIVCPELAFQPYLATPETAIVDREEALAWAAKTALRFKAGVCVGCIRKEDGKLYNSVIIVDPQGQLVAQRDKHFLYSCDKSWATPGVPFAKVHLPWVGPEGIDAMFAICNDINGLTFEPQDMIKLSLANACAAQKVRLLVLSTAWCSAAPEDPPQVHDLPVRSDDILDYWLNRLEPMLGSDTSFVAADRVGREPIPGKSSTHRIHYCGTSVGVSLKEPRLCSRPLSAEEEGVCVCELPL